MSFEEILDMLKKDFIHLGLEKKETKELQVGLDEYIKAISFIIYFLYSSFPISTKIQCLFRKIDNIAIIKTLQDNLANISISLSKTLGELDKKIIFLVNAINKVIGVFTFRVRLCPRSISGFVEKCKDT